MTRGCEAEAEKPRHDALLNALSPPPGQFARSLTRVPIFRAITLKPSYLISCSHRSPEGGFGPDEGRHGGMNPTGRVRGRNIARS